MIIIVKQKKDTVKKAIEHKPFKSTLDHHLRMYIDYTVYGMNADEVAAKYKCTDRTVYNAVDRFRGRKTTAPEYLLIAIARTEHRIAYIWRKLQLIERGRFSRDQVEKTGGKYGRETTKSYKKVYFPTVEAALLKELRENERLLSELYGILKNPAQEAVESLADMLSNLPGVKRKRRNAKSGA